MKNSALFNTYHGIMILAFVVCSLKILFGNGFSIGKDLKGVFYMVWHVVDHFDILRIIGTKKLYEGIHV